MMKNKERKATKPVKLAQQIMAITVDTTVRKGWDEAFKKMAENGDDKLLIPDVFDDETFENWT